jgi:hypothetical protein
MTYGMALYEHDLPLFTFKEMIKLLHGVYKKHGLGPQARFRAGIAAWDAGHPRAAVLQWRLCAKAHADTPWGENARKAIRTTLASPDLTAAQRSQVEAAMDEPLPKVPKRNKPPCWQRFSLGQEFLMVGIRDDGQAAMEFMKALTVTRATKGKYDERVVPQASRGMERAL